MGTIETEGKIFTIPRVSGRAVNLSHSCLAWKGRAKPADTRVTVLRLILTFTERGSVVPGIGKRT